MKFRKNLSISRFVLFSFLIFCLNLCCPIPTWTTASLSQGRSQLASTSTNNIALFGGGKCNGDETCSFGYSEVVDLWNQNSNIWTTASLSEARQDLAAVSLKGFALFAGGWCSGNSNCGFGYSKKVDIWNQTSNIWTTSSLSQARQFLIGTSANGFALFGGGFSDIGASPVVDLWNSTSNSWSTAILSEPRYNLAATSVNQIALFGGGLSNSETSSVVDLWNSTSNLWSTASLSEARQFLAATSINEFAIFAGGSFNAPDSSKFSSMVDLWNSNFNLWTTASLSQARQDLSATSINNLALFGGGLSSKGFSTQVDLWNATSKLWITSSLSEGRNQLAATSAGGVALFGGGNNGEIMNIVNLFNASLNANEANKAYLEIEIIIPILTFFIITLFLIFIYKGKHLWKNKLFSKENSSSRKRPISTLEINEINEIYVFERVGGGTFGDVYRGLWNPSTEVALKKLKDKEQIREFKNEATVLQTLRHPNIVQFFGIHLSSTGECYLVTEYLSKGSLERFLRREKNIPPEDFLCMAKDTAAGMIYLHSKYIIHRDLALRNLLVAPGSENSKFSIKISDFGMSKITSEEYYKSESKTIPVKWCSPEVIKYGKFSFQSDIWAFGVTMWEIFSYGMIPYSGLSNKEAVSEILVGNKLQKPENCPNEIYELMDECWKAEPTERISFNDLFESIQSLWLEKFLNQNQTDKRSSETLSKENTYIYGI